VNDIKQLLETGLGATFSVDEKGDALRVRTPFLFPDGDVVDVFVKRHGSELTLTDFGEALGWLRMQSRSERRTAKQQRMVHDICATQGVELFKGQLVLRCATPSAFPEALVRLAEAMVRVADISLTLRARTQESRTDDVAELLSARCIAFERAVRVAGRSGREWVIDFHTRTPSRSTLVCVLAPGSRAAAKRLTEHVFTTWHDLAVEAGGGDRPLFVSLFDDTTEVWADEDFRLVESVSTIGRWSRPDELSALLAAAA
jgi:hypothetical protein